MTSPVASLPQIGRSWKAQIINSSGTGLVTVVTPNGSFTFAKISALIACNNDTNPYNITWGITRGGTFYPLGTKAVPAGAGTVAGTPAVNLLDPTVEVGLPTDADGVPYVFLEQGNGDTLQAESGATVTSAKAVTIHAIGAEY